MRCSGHVDRQVAACKRHCEKSAGSLQQCFAVGLPNGVRYWFAKEVQLAVWAKALFAVVVGAQLSAGLGMVAKAMSV
jgi:hypothetical protein